MRMIWSHLYGSRVVWKISCVPSADQYASAFSPPAESCFRFARCVSRGSIRLGAFACGAGGGAGGALAFFGGDEHATRVAIRTARFTPRRYQDAERYALRR